MRANLRKVGVEWWGLFIAYKDVDERGFNDGTLFRATLSRKLTLYKITRLNGREQRTRISLQDALSEINSLIDGRAHLLYASVNGEDISPGLFTHTLLRVADESRARGRLMRTRVREHLRKKKARFQEEEAERKLGSLIEQFLSSDSSLVSEEELDPLERGAYEAAQKLKQQMGEESAEGEEKKKPSEKTVEERGIGADVKQHLLEELLRKGKSVEEKKVEQKEELEEYLRITKLPPEEKEEGSTD